MAWQKDFQLVLGPVGSVAAKLAQAIDVSQLRCTFKVKKTLLPKPNHSEITVYNLNHDSQSFLQSTPAIACRLEAGYLDEGRSQIYLGEVRTGDTRQVGSNYLTKFSTDDKGRKHQTQQINIPIGAGASVREAIQKILAAFNVTGGPWGYSTVGQGNLDWAMNELKKRGITSLHPRGGFLSGYAAQVMTDLCHSANLEWSIQDGALFIVPYGAAVGDRSIVLSASTGLLSSPAVDNEGVVTAECVLLPGIRPGVVVDFDAKYLKGGYRLTQCEWHGDTHGKDWKIKFQGHKY